MAFDVGRREHAVLGQRRLGQADVLRVGASDGGLLCVDGGRLQGRQNKLS